MPRHGDDEPAPIAPDSTVTANSGAADRENWARLSAAIEMPEDVRQTLADLRAPATRLVSLPLPLLLPSQVH